MNLSEIKALLSDPSERAKLSVTKLAEFYELLKQAAHKSGKAQSWDSPADLAYDMSRKMGLKRNVWDRAPHLELLNKKLVQNFTGEIGPLMVNMPPRHGKSLLVSFWYPLWRLTKNPEELFMFLTYGDLYAQEWGGKIRDFLVTFGADLGITIDTKASSRKFWKTVEGAEYYAAGIEGQITGKGSTCLILDDPVKGTEAASSQLLRDKLLKTWQETILTRIHGTVVAIGTRWHEDDLLGRLEALSDSGVGLKWEVIKLPALAEQDDVLGRKEGDALWPEKWPKEKLLQIKDGQISDPLNPTASPYAFSALYQQRPTPEEGASIKRVWWKYYKAIPEGFDEIIISGDLAFKDLSSSDFVVFQVWGRLGGQFYLLDMIRSRMNFPETIEAFQNLCIKWPQAKRKLIEDTANAPALIASLHREIPGIIPIRPKGSKDARLSAAAPAIESGNVFVPEFKTAKWVVDLIEECATFPNAAHDDTVDALSMALNYFMPSGHRFTIKSAKQAAEEASRPTTTEEMITRSIHATLRKNTDREMKRRERRRPRWERMQFRA